MKNLGALSGSEPRTLAFVVALMFLQSGCVIPTGEMKSNVTRANLNKESPGRIHPGETTLADVLLTFGEPDAVSSDERKLAYRSQKITGIWFIPSTPVAVGGEFYRNYYLAVELDDHGVVRNREFYSRDHGKETPDVALASVGSTNTPLRQVGERELLGGEARWFMPPKEPEAQEPDRGPFVAGRIVFSESEIAFRDGIQLGNSKPRWSASYARLADCRLSGKPIAPRIVVRTRDDEVYSFTLFTSGGGRADIKKTEAAFRFINDHLPHDKPTP